MDIQFGTVSLIMGFGSVQSTARESVGDSVLSPISADALRSNVKGGLMEHRYGDFIDICDAFGIVEGDSSDKGPSNKALGLVSATGCALTLFGQ